jgi:hypothetical protein
MLRRNYCAIFRARNCALNFIAELAHIAGPVADHQKVNRLRRNLNVFSTEFGRVVVNVVIDNRRDF